MFFGTEINLFVVIVGGLGGTVREVRREKNMNELSEVIISKDIYYSDMMIIFLPCDV